MALGVGDIPLTTVPGMMQGMNTGNALINSAIENEIKRIQAQYAPVTSLADAASKLAYAQLMGPQFLAKLMGNKDLLANYTPEQKRTALESTYNAGTSQGTGNALLRNTNLLEQRNISPLGRFVNNVKNAFGYNEPESESQPQSNNALLQSPPKQNNMPTNNSLNNQQGPVTQGTGADAGSTYDSNGNDRRASQAQIDARANNNQETNPVSEGIANGSLYNNDTFAENAARYQSLLTEGKELGTERGKAISDLGKDQLALSNSGVILDRITAITQNPEMQNMRNKIPFFQDKQLSYLSKTGTPTEQKIIGDYISSLQAFKAATVNSFKGKPLEKEFNLADKIKIDENDTWNVSQGKLRSLTTLKKIAETKNDIVIDLMTDQHMNLGKAIKQANKLVNTKSIEKEVDKLLNPKPTSADIKHMSEKYKISEEEVKKRLKAKGII